MNQNGYTIYSTLYYYVPEVVNGEFCTSFFATGIPL